MKKVLIIDDEPDNLEMVSEMLRDHFQTLVASKPKDGIQLAVQGQPDLILLDVNMPDMNGFEVCKRLREQPRTRTIPIIMLTMAGSLENRVKGLELGADDYVTKPFHGAELIARVQARLRRRDSEEKEQSPFILANLKLDPASCQVWVNDKLVELTHMEFDLLRYFMERPNQVVTRSRLLGDLWPDSVVTDRTVDTHVANLRKKLKGFEHPISTVHGAGYILKLDS